MRVTLQDIYESCHDKESANERLKKLYFWLTHSGLEPMKKFAATLKNHWDQILNYFDDRYTNAVLEGLNSVVQNIKTRARGFRNNEYFATMIYLVCGGLPMEETMKIAAAK